MKQAKAIMKDAFTGEPKEQIFCPLSEFWMGGNDYRRKVVERNIVERWDEMHNTFLDLVRIEEYPSGKVIG